MSGELSAVEEHYLKRELLRIELNAEFERLNDRDALRKFGHPFSREAPRTSRKEKHSAQEKHEPVAAFRGEFPVLSHFLQQFVMTFPLLSKELVQDEAFWQGKVQVFFEHFMSMPFSSSFDREQLTKRRKMSLKMSKVILLFYNSGIAVSQEKEYYASEKYHISKGSEKATKLNQLTVPSKKNLQYLLTNEPVFFNGIDINVLAVVERGTLFPHEKLPKSPKKTAASKWMKSALGIDLSKLSLLESAGSKKHRYYFIIRVRKQDPKTELFLFRSYDDFKGLVKDLKTAFPGKKLPQLPHKNKIQASVKQEAVPSSPLPGLGLSKDENSDDLGNDEIEYEEFEDDTSHNDQNSVVSDDSADRTKPHSRTLPRERMRTSLRQYLRTLCQDKEVATGAPLKKFLFSKSARIDESDFSDAVKRDMKNRELIDLTNLEHQIKFQDIVFQRSLKLQNSLKELKTSLLQDEDCLMGLFREFKEKRDPSELSSVLRDFFDWCKIYMSATVYQLFLGNDSGYELYKQVRKLHKLLPYTIMIQILRFTNPIAIMKGMMDLFMAQPFGGHSLLQTIFSTILSDDLKGQDKEIKELEELIINNHQNGEELCAFFKKVVFENEDSSVLSMDTVHEEVKVMGLPVSIVVAMKGTEMGYVSSDVLADLMESYTYWRNEQHNGTELVHVKTNESLSSSVGVYFTRLKELLQLLVQERDKRLMKKLWDDPELSQLIKAMVSLFYDPMIKIFKVARMDLAFRNFEHFMTDLVALLDSIIDGNKGSVTVINIVDEINELINKHEISFYQFAHDVYVNDTQGIFEGFITWICSLLNFLQKSKFGDIEDTINLNDLLHNSDIDTSLLKEQLTQVINKRLESRKVYSELVRIKNKNEDRPASDQRENVKNVIENQWKQLNHMVIPSEASDLNLGDAELVDLDLDTQDYEFIQDEEAEELELKYKEILERDVPVTEIERFLTDSFRPYLHDFLHV